MANKTITINGRLYDAATGLPIEDSKPATIAEALAPKAPVAKPAVRKAVAVAPATPKAKPAVARPTSTPASSPRQKLQAPSTPAASAQNVAIKPPVKRQPPTPRTTQPSHAVHSSVAKRSETLARRVTKKPATPAKPLVRKPGQHMDIAQSRQITKFAPHPVVKETVAAAPASTKPVASRQKPTVRKQVSDIRRPAPVRPMPKIAAAPAARVKPQAPRKTASPAVVSQTQATPVDAPATVHPTVQRALEKKAPAAPAVKTTAAAATAKQVKDAQIETALSTVKTEKAPAKPKKSLRLSWVSKRSRKLLAAGAFIALAGLVMFGVYKLVPSISVSIAASQSGVNATYPEYTPDGYSLKQPVEYTDGKVALTFRSHSNDNNYVITQARSTWDSTAVLDNLVRPKVGENYITTKERGLTIYSYETNATWVSGGVLYTIDSSSTLSGHQIRKIATSL